MDIARANVEYSRTSSSITVTETSIEHGVYAQGLRVEGNIYLNSCKVVGPLLLGHASVAGRCVVARTSMRNDGGLRDTSGW